MVLCRSDSLGPLIGYFGTIIRDYRAWLAGFAGKSDLRALIPC